MYEKISTKFSDDESSYVRRNISNTVPSGNANPVKPRKGIRKKWEPRHKFLVLQGFKKQIANRRFPTKDAVLQFIKEHNSEFTPEDYPRIRTLVVNTYTFQ